MLPGKSLGRNYLQVWRSLNWLVSYTSKHYSGDLWDVQVNGGGSVRREKLEKAFCVNRKGTWKKPSVCFSMLSPAKSTHYTVTCFSWELPYPQEWLTGWGWQAAANRGRQQSPVPPELFLELIFRKQNISMENYSCGENVPLILFFCGNYRSSRHQDGILNDLGPESLKDYLFLYKLGLVLRSSLGLPFQVPWPLERWMEMQGKACSVVALLTLESHS